MANVFDEMRWKLFNKKYNILFLYGVKHGLIQPYSDELLDTLRHFYYGGIPASILLLYEKICNGYCLDRGPLVTLGFEDDSFKVIDANINSLRLNPQYIGEFRKGLLDENYAIHCFAERTTKDGLTWVYDTSAGLVFEKNLYYKMEQPQLVKVNDEKATMEFLRADFLDDMDIERDKYALHIILPMIESNLVPIKSFYLEQLKKEIAILKEELDYEGICKEIEEDMKRKHFL